MAEQDAGLDPIEPKVPDTEPTAPAPDAGTTQVDLEALLAKSNKDRSKANREAQAAQKKADELAAKIQEYEDRDKSEIEKALEKAKRAEEEKKALENRVAMAERKTALVAGGVDSPYLDYLASELSKAQDADPELKAEDFIEEKKKTLPAMFRGNGNGSPASGAGGPAQSGKTNKAQELTTIADRIHAIQTSGRFKSDSAQAELQSLYQKAAALRAEMT